MRKITQCSIITLSSGIVLIILTVLRIMRFLSLAVIYKVAILEAHQKIAMDKYGAVWGQGTGLQGQCYAIPTMQGGVETIKPYVDEFIEFAKDHQELTFLVTRIGCGIAGFKDSEIAPLFKEALKLNNVRLPKTFFNNAKDFKRVDSRSRKIEQLGDVLHKMFGKK